MIFKLMNLLIFLIRHFPRDKNNPQIIARLKSHLAQNGPIFVKLGQALSVRPDLVGDECARQLTSFQDAMPPFSFNQVSAILSRELPAESRQLIAHIDEIPVAAASIAQVHKITLNDGRIMALKVLRPHIWRDFSHDIKLLRFLSQIICFFSQEARRLRLSEVMDYLYHTAKKECDLRLEAASAVELAQNFKNEQDIFYVPQVEWRLTTRNIACFDWVDGVKFNDKTAIDALGLDARQIVANASRIFFLQIYRDGFFHGDLHPGNVFIRQDGVIVPVDFGIMGRISRSRQLFLADLLVGLLQGDYKLIAKIHREQGILDEKANLDDFALAMRAVGEKYLTRAWVDISVGALLGEMFEITREFGMPTQLDLLLYQKAVIMAEGLGRSLDSQVNMWLLSRPLIEEWLQENRGVMARFKEILAQIQQLILNFLSKH